MKELGVGIVGCGVISATYMQNMPLFTGIKLVACADMRADVAKAQAATYKIPALPIDTLLKRDDVDIIVNLTPPNAHFEVSLAALSAGKHVFSEKPLCAMVAHGRTLVAEAKARNLSIGCAPDTFLGAGGRLARAVIDEGRIGRILSGSCVLMSHGMEHWHPDPEFFYKPGGGPILDIGPYYLAALVNLLGPVAKVQARASTGFAERLVSSQGPRNGHRIKVETPTTVMALLGFANGVEIMFTMSWDVWKHGHPPIELYGSEGSMRVPDPNFFGGAVEISQCAGDWQALELIRQSLRQAKLALPVLGLRSCPIEPITAASALPRWRAPSPRARHIAPRAPWRATCSTSCTPFSKQGLPAARSRSNRKSHALPR